MNRIVFLVLRRMRAPLIVLIVSYSISILGFVLIPGVDAQGRTWHMDFFHAFYFVSYTASTIGFGELPNTFSPAQRMWAVFTIYLTVISWVYAIGKLITLAQDEAIRRAVTQNGFVRSVRSLADPFFIVCGYGDTGRLLVHALAERGIPTVVIDAQSARIDELSLEEPGVFIPSLRGDASRPDTLLQAGLGRGNCHGVVALTGSEHTNLRIAIGAKLLRADIPVICRADSADTQANTASFGTDHIINAFEAFSDRLALAVHSPSQHLIQEWLISVPDSPLAAPLYPPAGRWILCGYGRFGKTVHQRLTKEGVPVVIVEEAPERAGCAGQCVSGRGTEAHTLQAAGVDRAVGIVAGTDDDANNLSIIVTAHELNPTLFMVARQNDLLNTPLFTAAALDLVMQRSEVIARQIFTLLTKPLLLTFLARVRERGDAYANEVASRILAVTEANAPEVWTVRLTLGQAPAVLRAMAAGVETRLVDLRRDPRRREQQLACFTLALVRAEEMTLLPDGPTALQAGDSLLFCGSRAALRRMSWMLNNPDVLRYVQGDAQPPAGRRWLPWGR